MNDALLFMTILSTDLRALRRRGYNVDRILKQQKAERQAAEEAVKLDLKRMEEEKRLVSDYIPEGASDDRPPEIVNSTRPPPTPTNEVPPPTKDGLLPEGSGQKRISKQAANTFSNSLSNLRRRLQSSNILPPAYDGATSQSLLGSPQNESSQRRPKTPQAAITPLSDICKWPTSTVHYHIDFVAYSLSCH